MLLWLCRPTANVLFSANCLPRSQAQLACQCITSVLVVIAFAFWYRDFLSVVVCIAVVLVLHRKHILTAICGYTRGVAHPNYQKTAKTHIKLDQNILTFMTANMNKCFRDLQNFNINKIRGGLTKNNKSEVTIFCIFQYTVFSFYV